MPYCEFVVPTDEDLEDVLGVRSHPLNGEVATRVLAMVTSTGDQLRLSYDVPGRSIKVEWEQGSSRVVDIFREGATRLSAEALGGETFVRIRFETDALSGEMRIRIAPEIAIHDQLLIS